MTTRSEQLALLKNATKGELIRSYYGDEFVNATLSQLEIVNERFKSLAKSYDVHGRIPNISTVWRAALGKYAVRASRKSGLVGVVQQKGNLFSHRTYKKLDELTIEETRWLIFNERIKFNKSQKRLNDLNRTLGRLEAKYGSKQTILAGAF
ncbi:hypothetical protein [Mesoaciditoga lauensis]|uniref:hypothetical protein n=1 Tax=Mesoaciditoga lauensis TaxID=1495039 RepID=UPI00055B9CDC|nr:hypothetical protein [Mesoaciditoga lauensis]